MARNNKQQAAVDRLKAEVERLETENVGLKRENERLGGGVASGMRRCADCGIVAPDSFAFFGSAANDPDQSKCAACSRTLLHEAAVQHFTAGCRHCASDEGVYEGTTLAWML